MGMHDRDYYREDYAKKNGKRYDTKRRVYFIPPAAKTGRPHWALLLGLFLSLCALVFFGLRFFNSLA